MSIQIPLNDNAQAILKKNTSAHYLPCKIDFEGKANVNQFFRIDTIKNEENDTAFLSSSFRGRPLIGQTIQLPKGYKCVVLHETRKPLVEKQTRTFHITHAFDKLTYWNWDKYPSKNDPFISALDWLDIAQVLHKEDDE